MPVVDYDWDARKAELAAWESAREAAVGLLPCGAEFGLRRDAAGTHHYVRKKVCGEWRYATCAASGHADLHTRHFPACPRPDCGGLVAVRRDTPHGETGPCACSGCEVEVTRYADGLFSLALSPAWLAARRADTLRRLTGPASLAVQIRDNAGCVRDARRGLEACRAAGIPDGESRAAIGEAAWAATTEGTS